MQIKKMKNNDKKWEITFYVKNYDGTNKRIRKKGFNTRREAEEYYTDYMQRNDRSSHAKFEVLLNHYLKNRKINLRESTYYIKCCIIGKHILPYFKEIPICEITNRIIMEWQDSQKSMNLKPTTLKEINVQLSAILNHAVKFFDIPNNPLRIVGSMGNSHAEPKEIWTPEMFKSFIKANDEISPETSIIFEILFWTGMRVGELLALTREDIDFEKQIIKINKSYSKVQGVEIKYPPKTYKGIRDIMINSTLRDHIKEYTKKIFENSPDERLFTIQKHEISNQMKRTCEKAGIKYITAHGLRHCHASYLIEKGVNYVKLKTRLGHKKILTTLQTYAHLYPNNQEEIVKLIEKDTADVIDPIESSDEIGIDEEIDKNSKGK